MEHIHLKQCQSTQVEIYKHLEKHPNQNFLVSSDSQVTGRGQRGKSWFSTSNSLAMSFNLKPSNTITLTSLEMGILCCKFFKTHYNIELGLKWPNDLFIKNKKCGGILIQKNQFFICGIGLNLFHNNKFPKELPLIGSIFQNDQNVQSISSELYKFISDSRFNDDLIVSEFKKLCIHLNKTVEIIEDNKSFQGKFLEIGPHGEARILVGDEVKIFYSASLIIKSLN